PGRNRLARRREMCPMMAWVLIVVPFALVAKWSYGLATARNLKWSFIYAAVFGMLLLALDVSAFAVQDDLLAQKKWTAAALEFGFRLIANIPLTVVAWIAYRACLPKRDVQGESSLPRA